MQKAGGWAVGGAPTGGWELPEAASKIPPEWTTSRTQVWGQGLTNPSTPFLVPEPGWRGPGPSTRKWGARPGPRACVVSPRLGNLGGPLCQARLGRVGFF